MLCLLENNKYLVINWVFFFVYRLFALNKNFVSIRAPSKERVNLNLNLTFIKVVASAKDYISDDIKYGRLFTNIKKRSRPKMVPYGLYL